MVQVLPLAGMLMHPNGSLTEEDFASLYPNKELTKAAPTICALIIPILPPAPFYLYSPSVIPNDPPLLPALLTIYSS
jgi:hypothetical protein